MKALLLLLLAAMVLMLTVPATALSPSQMPKITAVKTTVPVFDIGQKIPVTTTTTKVTCSGWDNPQGFLTIESEPSGANITIIMHSAQGTFPGDIKKTTPIFTPFFTYCEGIEYKIILTKAGYKSYTSAPIVLHPGDSGQIHAILVPLTTTTQGQSQPTAIAVVTTPIYDFGSQAYALGAASPNIAQPAATADASGQPSQAPVPGTGSLSVITNPAGAAVEVDGLPQGASPATIPGLAAGAHNLTITKPGYAVLMTQVSIVAGQANEYSTTLLPSTVPTQKTAPGFETGMAALAVAGIILIKRPD